MGEIFSYLALGVIAVGFIGYAVYNIIKIFRMSDQDKERAIIFYLSGLVNMAEKQIGSGKGEEKLKMVEDFFLKNAPAQYKLMLKFLGKSCLKDLIESALSQIKENFCK